MRHDDGVFAAGEEQYGALELGGDFAHDEDSFGFQLQEMRATVVRLVLLGRGWGGDCVYCVHCVHRNLQFFAVC